MHERPHEPEQQQQASWSGQFYVQSGTPQSRRRRTNKLILITAGSILGLFVVIAAVGAAVGGGKIKGSPAAAAGGPTPGTHTSTAPSSPQPSPQGTHLAAQSVRDKSAGILTAATDHYAQVFAQGQAIVGSTRYPDGDAGLVALQDPGSAASKFSAWRQSSKAEQDVTTYQDAFSQADAGFDASDEPTSISTWRDDVANAQSDMARWVSVAVDYQISNATQAQLDAAAAKVQADLKTAREDIAAVQAGR